jgi:hypothetical protein
MTNMEPTTQPASVPNVITITSIGGREIWKGDAASVSVALALALKAGADLRSANLRSANLVGADLVGANLRSADLRSANLRGADLRSANLRSADLRSADLVGADLRSANLRSANLVGADLRSANLRSADLRSADLVGADLRSAHLRSANLVGADLRSANLRSADLRSANLVGAETDLLLEETKKDLFLVLDCAPAEVPALLEKLREGKVDGSVYEGECSCLVGTLATARGCKFNAIPGLAPNGERPAERFFLRITTGHKPEFSHDAALADAWITEWILRRSLAELAKTKIDASFKTSKPGKSKEIAPKAPRRRAVATK